MNHFEDDMPAGSGKNGVRMNDYLLFDLDGTLTDSKEGITKSVQYALASMGIEEPDLAKLEAFIGPPLHNSFEVFYGMDEEQANKAVQKYRERFQDTGIFENELYEGIPEMLKKLRAKGKKIAIASSKPQVFVERILEYFEISQYFHVVVGSELDGTRTEKAEVVEEALRQLLGDIQVEKGEVVIIGDRKFDIEGGQAHKLTTVGVTYGFGGIEELKEAKADYIVRTVDELSELLLRGSEDEKYEPAFNKMWSILFPVLISFFVLQMANYVAMYLTVLMGEKIPAWTQYFLEYNEKGQLQSMTGTGSTVMSLLAFLITGVVLYKLSVLDIREAAVVRKRMEHKKLEPLTYVFVVIATIGISLGLNILLDLLGITDKSNAMAELQQQRYSAPLLLALLTYGLVAPITEEFLFRGIIYNRMKRYMKVTSSLFFSTLLFAIYHGNIIAGIYAFAMGLLITYAYEKTGRYYMAVVVHILANVCAYTMTYTGLLSGSLLNWFWCVILLLVGAGGLVLFRNYEIGTKKKAGSAMIKQSNIK